VSLYARVAWWIVSGFVVLLVVLHLLFVHDRMVAGARAHAISLVERTLCLRQLVTNAAAAEQSRLFAAASGPEFRVEVGAKPRSPGEPWRHADEVERAVADHLRTIEPMPHLSTAVFVARSEHGLGAPALQIATPLDDGQYLLAT